MRFRRSQSTLEYVIVLAAIIAVITVVARTYLANKVKSALQKAADRIQTEAEKF
ncbi:MAG: hypothetical protein NC826_05035 [Candidatus Omnitrophica bacterium]|nr:hypothetical protein [Candidatus Omnitrophota bacterium]